MGPVITASMPMLEGLHTKLSQFFGSRLNVIVLERDLQESDFHFDLGNSEHLKVLLLSRSSVQDNRQETVARLKRFARMATGSHRKAIAFLLTEEPFSSASGRYSLEGLLALQVLYACSSLPQIVLDLCQLTTRNLNELQLIRPLSTSIAESLPDHLPTIPIPDSSCFMTCVQEYIGSLANLPPFSRPLTDTVSLLHHMRAPSSPLLPEQDANVLSDLFPSLRSLSQAIRTQEGRFALDDYLGSQMGTDIARFWKEDHVCE
jgi:hypothetical protein